MGRVADLIPIRYGRMLVSSFTFFRGAAVIMAADLATTPVSGVTMQLCGDAHASNFGLFGTPERRMLFDINDFDMTLPAPWEWDVKRLAVAASLEVMGRDRDFAPSDRRAIVMADRVPGATFDPSPMPSDPCAGTCPLGRQNLRSPPTWARQTPSIGLSETSQSHMPTKTSATTRPSLRRLSRGG
jgi:hypothetical protein